MKLKLTITIPGEDCEDLRNSMAEALWDVAENLPDDLAGSGQCYDQNGNDCGHYCLFIDPDTTEEISND